MRRRIQKDGKWKCVKCNNWKLPSEFYKSSRDWNGIKTTCKNCGVEHHREYMYVYNIKRKYGISIYEYETLLIKQNGVCAICKNKKLSSKKNGRLCVDHNHESGEIRGLLCSNCNTALGLMKDDINSLKMAIEYLKN